MSEYPTEEWIRIQLIPGGFLIIPLGQSNGIKALRLTETDASMCGISGSAQGSII
ncbi:hypothetical protein B0F90DRAFT_1733234 [Multifurca ochricompacta]|uniref:Uncharacterized protein n=1 Tax=Multifurca ochricompacta TaxID=376703 RepID=A0AAD4QL21_9AGAM|nr:hypothetical protein B0F90DRAFT_1733234 [Multifurca ochricompacta]